MLTFLKGRQDLLSVEHRKAIVTLAIGDEYYNLWERFSRESWEEYAGKFGYDIIVITDHLDTSERARARSPSWQKLLVLSLDWARKYERIAWIDSDIIISNGALDIVECVPDPGKVGICPNNQLSSEDRHIFTERLRGFKIPVLMWDTFYRVEREKTYKEYEAQDDDLVDYGAGVLVLSPAHHAQILLDVYNRYENKGRLYEQLPLASTLHKAGLDHLLSSRFNWHVAPAMRLSYFAKYSEFIEAEQLISFLRNELDKSYFLHFAGGFDLMKQLLEWYQDKSLNLPKLWEKEAA